MIGRSIGNYRIVRALGEGGMGTVYLAEHPRIGKKVAIKILHKQFSANADLVSRFFQEARAVNEIKHPNIVDISDFGEAEDGTVYLVMELLDGETLRDRLIRERRLGSATATAVVRQVAAALDAAHHRQIVHRDLKPENIFLVRNPDGTEGVKLFDFGVAKLIGDERTGHKTAAGAVVGTPHYMPPEQLVGRSIDARVDIYALGVVLFEMVTGRLPFTQTQLVDLMSAIVKERPPEAGQIEPSVPPALERCIDRCLEKDPAARPQTMKDLLSWLDDAPAPVSSAAMPIDVLSGAAAGRAPVSSAAMPILPRLAPLASTAAAAPAPAAAAPAPAAPGPAVPAPAPRAAAAPQEVRDEWATGATMAAPAALVNALGLPGAPPRAGGAAAAAGASAALAAASAGAGGAAAMAAAAAAARGQALAVGETGGAFAGPAVGLGATAVPAPFGAPPSVVRPPLGGVAARPVAPRPGPGERLRAYAATSTGRRNLSIGGIGALVLLGFGVVAAIVPRRGPAAPAAALTGSATVAAMASASILELDSSPTGAWVVRGSDGQNIGRTPLRESQPADGRRVEYLVRMTGYVEARVPFKFSESGEHSLTVPLAREERGAGGRGSGGDDDGGGNRRRRARHKDKEAARPAVVAPRPAEVTAAPARPVAPVNDGAQLPALNPSVRVRRLGKH